MSCKNWRQKSLLVCGSQTAIVCNVIILTWCSNGQMTFLQLDLIVGDGESSDEGVNLELGHASTSNV